jgi:tetratricopeptide (TPR) repeat protein
MTQGRRLRDPGVVPWPCEMMVWVLLFVIPGSCTGAPAQRPDPTAEAQQAKQAMLAGRFNEAIKLYGEVARVLPNNPGIILDLALALHSAGRYGEAIPRFRTVLQAKPENASVWLLLGLDYLHVQNQMQAQLAFEQVLRLQPHNEDARFGLAEAWMRLHQPEESVAEYEQLSRLDPANPRVWQGLGLGYAALSRQLFREIEKQAPGSAYEDALLAQTLASQHHYRAAFGFYRRALAKAPGLPALHAGLAEVYEKTGHPQWAQIEQARERRTLRSDCARRTLECEFQTGDYDRLLSSARQIRTPEAEYWKVRTYQRLSLQAFAHLSHMPPSPEVHELLAQAYTLQGQYHAAAAEWQAALELAPSDGKLGEGLARSLWLDHQYPRAELLLRTLIQKDPESANLNFELGDTLLQLGEPRAATPYLARAVALSPGTAPAQASLARAYLRSGRVRQAIPHLRAALPGDVHGAILYELAEAYRQTGQTALAKQAMQQFAALSKASLQRTQKLDEQQAITGP